ARAGVDDDLRPVAAGELELAVIDVDRGDAQPHGDGVLDGDVAEPADPGDQHPLAGLGVGDLEALVDGDPGAEDRRGGGRVHAVGDDGAVPGVDEHVLAEGAVDGVAAVLLGLAQRLPAGLAVLALAAGAGEPRVADGVPDLDALDAVADG